MENRESKRRPTEEEAENDFSATKRPRRLLLGLPSSEADRGVGPSSSWMCSTNKKKFLDVFLSHRGGGGPDTKCTLAFHMYDLLQDRGVEAFLGTEEELQSGETLPEVIVEAISRWKVHVCILSNGYAESVRCLQELKMMVDKYEMGTCVVIPVFYDVRVSDVGNLQGPFGQRFQQQIVERNFYDGRRWRSAMRKVSEINGYEGKGEVCMAIVKKVCEQLDVGPVRTIGGAFGTHKQLLNSEFSKILWNNIKASSQHDLKQILKFSYDQLDTELEKCLFLNVAIFLHWEKVDLLIQCWQCDEDGESDVLYALDMLKRNILIEGTEKVKALSLVSNGSAVLDEDGCPWSAEALNCHPCWSIN